MKVQEMRQMTLDDLKMRLAQSSEEIFKLKFRLVTQPLDDPLQIRRIRRDIARIKTLIREREISGIAPSAPMTAVAPAPRTKVKAKAKAKAKTKSAAKTKAAPKTKAKSARKATKAAKATKKASAARRSK